MPRIRPRLWKARDGGPSFGRSLGDGAAPSAAGMLDADDAGLAASGGGVALEELLPLPGLEVETTSEDARHTLTLAGALELNSVGVLEAALSRLWSQKVAAVTLDLRGVTFIDSSGLWTITTLQKWCAREAIGFMIIPGPDPVQHVFELTGLSDVLPFARGYARHGDGA